jgi:thiol reductant ABC exporter CydD subunit
VGPIDRRLMREAPEAGRFLAGAGLLAALSAAAAIVWAVLIGKVVARVFLGQEDLGAISDLLVALVAITAVRATIAWGLEASGHATSWRVRRRLRRRLLEQVLRARPSGLADLSTGELAIGATSALDALDPYFVHFLPQLVLATVVSPAIIAWVAFHDLLSALIMLLTLPLIPLFGALIGKAAEERTQRRLAALTRMSSHFLDVVRGLATLRAYRRGKAQAEAIARTSEEFRRQTMGTLRIAFLSAFALELAATMSIALIAASIGIRLVNGDVALAPSFAVLVLAPELYLPMRGVAAQFHASRDGLAAAHRAFELIELEPAARVPAAPLAPPDPGTAAIRFEQVAFAYEGRGTPVFDGFDCEIGPGKCTVLSGASGAGKTTLLALLMRFADPGSGRIRAGDVDLRDLDPDEWRRRIGWLPQQPRLLAGTIAEALRIGAPDAGAEDLLEALRAADAADLVAALPDGLETRVGEGGVPLSAGELRRVALARALVRRAPLLVLDEPTAHVDAEAAARIRSSLAALKGEQTVVIAGHDPLLLPLADQVIELPPGGGEPR